MPDRGLAHSRWASSADWAPKTTAWPVVKTTSSLYQYSDIDTYNTRYTPQDGQQYQHEQRQGQNYSNGASASYNQDPTRSSPLQQQQSNPNHMQSPAEKAATTRIPTPEAELARYSRIVRRLKWKLPYLAHGYREATAPLPVLPRPPSPSSSVYSPGFLNGDMSHQQHQLALQQRKAEEEEYDRLSTAAQHHLAEARLMFKLDFFEYYMLLERALVHLMGVFGISISRQQQQRQQQLSNPGHLGGGGGGTHRYHANVLDALDKADNPLHKALGRGDVRMALARAKDLRNRWKNADADADLCSSSFVDEANGGSGGGGGGDGGRGGDQQQKQQQQPVEVPLERYDLEHILATIFDGFDQGYVVAERFVEEVRAVRMRSKLSRGNGAESVGVGGGEGGFAGLGGEVVDGEEEQWGFMVDAMDWERV